MHEINVVGAMDMHKAGTGGPLIPVQHTSLYVNTFLPLGGACIVDLSTCSCSSMEAHQWCLCANTTTPLLACVLHGCSWDLALVLCFHEELGKGGG